MDDAERVIERSHQAWDSFMRGDPTPALELLSRLDDVTLGNPFGPFVRGWQDVAAHVTEAAGYYRDGEAVRFDRVATYASGDLVCIVEDERFQAKIGGSDEVTPFQLRVSTILRREDGAWRIASRHADPITTPRPPESVIRQA